MNRVPPRFIGGSAYFRLPDSEVLEPAGYFRCLNSIRPLFARQDFQSSTPGFYINYIRIPEVPGGSLRLSAFSIDGLATRRAIEAFISETSDITVFRNDVSTGSLPVEDQLPQYLKTWNCLDASTQILLDLFGNPRLNWAEFQNLVLNYRLRLLPQKISPKTAFEPAFKQHSEFYLALERSALDNQYWETLFSFFSEALPIHFLTNMALAWDDVRYDPTWFN